MEECHLDIDAECGRGRNILELIQHELGYGDTNELRERGHTGHAACFEYAVAAGAERRRASQRRDSWGSGAGTADMNEGAARGACCRRVSLQTAARGALSACASACVASTEERLLGSETAADKHPRVYIILQAPTRTSLPTVFRIN